MVKSFTFITILLLIVIRINATAQTWSWASVIGDTTVHTAIYAMHRYSDS